MGSDPPDPPWGVSGTEEEPLVPLVHLLKKDEGEHSVGAQAGVVGGEALPEAEEALVPHHLQQHILEKGQCVRGGPKNNEKPSKKLHGCPSRTMGNFEITRTLSKLGNPPKTMQNFLKMTGILPPPQ